MGIKDVLKKLFKKDEKYKQLEHEMKIRKVLEQRQKNANERELERYMEEQRQERIKQQLKQIRKKRTHDWWTSNMFKGNQIFNSGGGSSILKQKNIFGLQSDNLKGDNMFWK